MATKAPKPQVTPTQQESLSTIDWDELDKLDELENEGTPTLMDSDFKPKPNPPTFKQQSLSGEPMTKVLAAANKMQTETLKKAYSRDKPWTKEELLSAGIPKEHHHLAHWWGNLQDMKDDLGL